jgi:beta-lactamase class A
MNRPIIDELQQLIRQSRASAVAIAARRMEDTQEILLNADLPFHPASTIKLCIMMETFRQARQGSLSLDDPIKIKNVFSSLVDGSPYSLEADDDSETELYQCIGQSFSRRELVRRMIVVSSNLATNLLIEQLQPDEINEFMRQLGAHGLITRRGVEDKAAYRLGLNNSATARGLRDALLKLGRGEVVSPEDSNEMIRILSEQEFNEMIPARLPANVRVAHKTGSTGDYFHDAGIVYPPDGQPFVLTILTRGYPEDEEEAAHAFVASLASAVYDYWNPRVE